MLNSFIFQTAVGIVLGTLSGLGVGGGSLLLLWLTLVTGLPQSDARIINLLFFIPSALISCLFRWKQGVLRPGAAVIPIAAGLAGAYLGTRIGAGMDLTWSRKLLGVCFVLCGLREVFYRPRN